MSINTISDLIYYLESGNAFAEALKLDDDTLELLHSLAKGLHNVAANELAFRRLRSLAKGLHNVAANELAFRRRVKERQP